MLLRMGASSSAAFSEAASSASCERSLVRFSMPVGQRPWGCSAIGRAVRCRSCSLLGDCNERLARIHSELFKDGHEQLELTVLRGRSEARGSSGPRLVLSRRRPTAAPAHQAMAEHRHRLDDGTGRARRLALRSLVGDGCEIWKSGAGFGQSVTDRGPRHLCLSPPRHAAEFAAKPSPPLG